MSVARGEAGPGLPAPEGPDCVSGLYTGSDSDWVLSQVQPKGLAGGLARRARLRGEGQWLLRGQRPPLA